MVTAAACPVTGTELRYAQFRALEALGRLWSAANIDYANCRISVTVNQLHKAEAVSRVEAADGLVPILAGQQIPRSTASAIVVVLVAGGGSCCCLETAAPCGWQAAQIALSPDLNNDRFGEVLEVDQAGLLFRYSFQAGNKLGKWAYLAQGWGQAKVYAPGDWDGDGKADLIGVRAGQMLLYPGDGKGGISKGIEIGHGWSKYTVIPAGDLTGDRILNMLAINKQTGVLLMYAGNGKGGFQSGYKQVGHGWKNMQLFAAGDMNQDGQIDILGLKSDGRLFFYAGKGGGTFRPAVQVGHGWTGMTLAAGADLDGDGKADIVGRTKNGDLLFYRGIGVGTFAKPIKLASDW